MSRAIIFGLSPLDGSQRWTANYPGGSVGCSLTDAGGTMLTHSVMGQVTFWAPSADPARPPAITNEVYPDNLVIGCPAMTRDGRAVLGEGRRVTVYRVQPA